MIEIGKSLIRPEASGFALAIQSPTAFSETKVEYYTYGGIRVWPVRYAAQYGLNHGMFALDGPGPEIECRLVGCWLLFGRATNKGINKRSIPFPSTKGYYFTIYIGGVSTVLCSSKIVAPCHDRCQRSPLPTSQQGPTQWIR